MPGYIMSTTYAENDFVFNRFPTSMKRKIKLGNRIAGNITKFYSSNATSDLHDLIRTVAFFLFYFC